MENSHFKIGIIQQLRSRPIIYNFIVDYVKILVKQNIVKIEKSFVKQHSSRRLTVDFDFKATFE